MTTASAEPNENGSEEKKESPSPHTNLLEMNKIVTREANTFGVHEDITEKGDGENGCNWFTKAV